jgi:hypothetical protein
MPEANLWYGVESRSVTFGFYFLFMCVWFAFVCKIDKFVHIDQDSKVLYACRAPCVSYGISLDSVLLILDKILHIFSSLTIPNSVMGGHSCVYS